jgi:hypothetical protein
MSYLKKSTLEQNLSVGHNLKKKGDPVTCLNMNQGHNPASDRQQPNVSLNPSNDCLPCGINKSSRPPCGTAQTHCLSCHQPDQHSLVHTTLHENRVAPPHAHCPRQSVEPKIYTLQCISL